jgi:hypothetical protein
LRYFLKEHIYKFTLQYALDLLIVENALSLPVNVPLGLALTEFIAETQLPAIAHHHDFPWERKRFAVTAAADYLRAAFPPTLPSVVRCDQLVRARQVACAGRQFGADPACRSPARPDRRTVRRDCDRPSGSVRNSASCYSLPALSPVNESN